MYNLQIRSTDGSIMEGLIPFRANKFWLGFVDGKMAYGEGEDVGQNAHFIPLIDGASQFTQYDLSSVVLDENPDQEILLILSWCPLGEIC